MMSYKKILGVLVGIGLSSGVLSASASENLFKSYA